MLWQSNSYKERLITSSLELISFVGLATIGILVLSQASETTKAIALFGYFLVVTRVAKGNLGISLGPLVLINLFAPHIQVLFVFNFFGQRVCQLLIRKQIKIWQDQRINHYLFSGKLTQLLQLGVESASLIHDLKSPLTSFGAGLQLLPTQTDLVVKELKHSHKKMTGLVEKLDSKVSKRLIEKRFSLCEVLDCAPAEILLDGDKHLLERAIQNLINNATKAADGEKPHLAINQLGEWVEIIISNRGSKLATWPWEDKENRSRQGWGLVISYLAITKNWNGEMLIVKPPKGYLTSIMIRLPSAGH